MNNLTSSTDVVEYTRTYWNNYIGDSSSLKLNGRGLTDDNISELAEILKTNTTIHFIDLQDNKITSKGAKAFASAILVNKTFAVDPRTSTGALNLANNKIGKEGLDEIISSFDKTKRYYHSLCVAGEIGVTEEELEEIAESPEFQRVSQRTKDYRKIIFPDENCVIS